MGEVLVCMGFGEEFLKWINWLYELPSGSH